MTDFPLSRRSLLALSAAAVAMPGAAIAQASPTPAILDRLAALSGFDPLPRDLLRGLIGGLGRDAAELDGQDIPDELSDRVLRALYTGILPGDAPERIAFSGALMWAAVEESNNVISYCGGLPGYWAEPPETT